LTGADNSFHSGETIVGMISFELEPIFDGDGKLRNICVDVNGLYPKNNYFLIKNKGFSFYA